MEKKTRNRKSYKVRAAFTLDKEVLEALDDFSLMTGQSKSAFVNDCIKQAMPQLKKLTEIIAFAKQNPNAALSSLDSDLEQMISQFTKSLRKE